MDSDYLHDRMYRLNVLNSMIISTDNDALVMLYDHELLNVNVGDVIQQVLVEMRHTIIQV